MRRGQGLRIAFSANPRSVMGQALQNRLGHSNDAVFR
jgi:hypothetical protein